MIDVGGDGLRIYHRKRTGEPIAPTRGSMSVWTAQTGPILNGGCC